MPCYDPFKKMIKSGTSTAPFMATFPKRSDLVGNKKHPTRLGVSIQLQLK